MKLRQIPAGYLVVGIDPHKKKHAAVAITEDIMVRSRFKFTNSGDGFEQALKNARAEMIKSSCRGVMFAIETGGHFWRNFAYFLEERGIPFRLISPFTLKRMRDGRDLNRRKNDFRDAEMAAGVFRTGDFTETKLPQGVYADLRSTYSAYFRLVKERSRLINLLKGLLDGLFPEFTQVFKDPCGRTALTVLSVYPSPASIANLNEDIFIAAIRTERQGRLMVKKLKALHEAARTSIGIKPGADGVSMEVTQLVSRYHLIEQQVDRLVKSLIFQVDKTNEGKYLLSIPGINYLSAASLLAELGPFNSYSNGKQLVKMAGTNPIEAESGGKQLGKTPMSKKGRPRLRYSAWSAVIPLFRHNPDFRAWAKRLRERPAHANPLNGKEVVGAALNRLLRLVYALVKRQEFYRSPQIALAVN
ncbi:MAG: IS110 family transposase [bacterium]|nr:IS110 family transposase [bacterium]